MNVFKFGGASVRDAVGFRNVGTLLQRETDQHLVVVVSALGKTTNALETVVASYLAGRTAEALQRWQQIVDAHDQICADLTLPPRDSLPLQALYETVHAHLTDPAFDPASAQPEAVYDQLVSVGELLSTHLVVAYLMHIGLPVVWADARLLVRTDARFGEAVVDWKATNQLINSYMATETGLIVTQGFIGGTATGQPTTLGREGSDYSAAIFAHCLNAHSVTIWKDVPGVLNADPRYFEKTQLLPRLTYQDATELAYYGATVIHPKTIKPLQNKGIPLRVRSFLQPDQPGTLVSNQLVETVIPSFIFKVNQWLISLSPTDFSFIAEEKLSLIFGLFAEAGVRINLMQNTALSFTVVVDNRPDRVAGLLEKLRTAFRVTYNQNLELITVRHYDQATLDRVLDGKRLLLEQKSRTTAQLVVQGVVGTA